MRPGSMPPCPAPRSRSGGFTLIEILVVLAIVGIALGMIAVNLSRDTAAVLEDDARRLALVLQYAHDEAVTAGRPIAWTPDAEGYGFLRRERGQGWARIETARADGALAPRAWPAHVRLAEASVAGVALPSGEPLVFSPSGFNEPFVVVLASGSWRIALAGDVAGKVRLERAREEVRSAVQ